MPYKDREADNARRRTPAYRAQKRAQRRHRYATDPAYRLAEAQRNTRNHARRQLARAIESAEEMYA